MVCIRLFHKPQYVIIGFRIHIVDITCFQGMSLNLTVNLQYSFLSLILNILRLRNTVVATAAIGVLYI